MTIDREAAVSRLRREEFELLVVGGGATGCGIALDAATRGLRVALVERDDFSAGTSSRSTKLIHGGVRYLEQAVKQFDRSQFNLVRDALKERAVLLRIAPHLAHPLPLVTPLYNWLDVPYYLTGLKLYDWLAGKANLSPSAFVDAQGALQRFPMLRGEGLRGAVVYFDGQFDDARMNVALALTAAEQGAAVANHVALRALVKQGGRIAGAELEDRLSGERWETGVQAVINAGGPFADEIRLMEDPAAQPMLSASSGVHIVLDGRFSPPGTGLLIPQTEDGRVLFLLPWLGHTLVGTTDRPAAITSHPRASEEEVEYILRHVRSYFSLPVERGDVLASWSGLRPLVSNPAAADTARLSRDHVLSLGPAGMLTVAGGKWTTYRRMAIDAVDELLRRHRLGDGRQSATEQLVLIGGRGYSPTGAGALQERFGLEAEVASHLNRAYGDRAREVAELAEAEGLLGRLAAAHPFLEAEVVYGARVESARSSVDILARRTRLGFLDRGAAIAAVPRVSELLAATLGWPSDRLAEDRAEAVAHFV